MKQLSTKGRYGLRALIDLAVNSKGKHVSLSSIAERQNISEIYLEQVFAALRKGGIIKSIKGANGGYLLAYEQEKIIIGDILRILEGDISILGEKGEEVKENSITYCIKQNVWDQVDKNINELIDSLTLADLVNEHRKLKGDIEPMFYI